MKNKNLVIIHHPGVYSIRDTFTGDQKLPRILEQSSKNTSIPDQFKSS
jgi:hypothetical protein